MNYELAPLPYSYDDLEPYIDQDTMKIHHGKHHAAYCNNLNAAVEKVPELFEKKPEELLQELESVPESIRTAVRNNGGGFVNHNFFWTILRKGSEDNAPKNSILAAIEKQWGTVDKFKEEFSAAAMSRFGSGWAWLVMKDSDLSVMSTANQDSPLSQEFKPLLAIDVWEHAYYLKYQNRRAEYVESFWKIVNWDKVNELYEE